MKWGIFQCDDAGEYCDFVSSSLFPEGQASFLSEKSVTAEEQNEMNRKAQEVYNAQQQGIELLQAVYDQTGNMINARRTLDGAVCDIRERTYSVTLQQTEYRLTVDTEIAAFQYTDSADYDALRPAYDNFMLNTRVSDEFIQLNQQLTEMLVTAMAKGRAQALSDYNVDVSTVADQTIGTGDSYVEDHSKQRGRGVNSKERRRKLSGVLAAVLLWTVPGMTAGAAALTAGSVPSILEDGQGNGGGILENETEIDTEGKETTEQETEKQYNTSVQLTEEDILAMNGGDASFVYSDEGYLTFLRGKYYKGRVTDFEEAVSSLNGVAELLGISKGSEFFAAFAERDKNGYTYILYKQRYGDLTIQNAVLKIVIDPDGYTAGLSCSFAPNVGIAQTETSVTAKEAEQAVLDWYPEYELQVFSDHTRQTSVTYNGVACHVWAVFTDYPEEEAAPDGRSYLEHLVAYDGSYLGYLAVSSPEELVLGDDAQAEAARCWFEGLEEASYTGTVRLHDGTERTVTIPVARDPSDGTYYLADVKRHILLADCYSWLYENEMEPWSSKDNIGWPDAYLLTYESYLRVYDFYLEYGLESVDGFGTPIAILTDYCNKNGTPENNACYMGICNGWALFGASDLNDYGECIDVAAHEFTHGVTTYTIGGDLYENEPGAVNEGFSDVMGNLCELLLGATDDTDWLLGENCGSPVRSMSCPWDYKQPVTIGGKYYQEPAVTPMWENDYGGVHTNNSLISHIACQLCRDGMEWKEAFGLWRETMNMLTPASGYREVHEALKFVAQIRGMDQKWIKQIDILCEQAGY